VIVVKRILAVALLAAGPAAAQDLDGLWRIDVQTNQGQVQAELVLNGNDFAMEQLLTTAEGYQYPSSQSGVVQFEPPDMIRLVPMSFAPTDQGGRPLPFPSPVPYQILELSQDRLVLLNLVCAQTGSAESCTSVMTRVQ
jgi:hypothetical protein